MWSRQFWLATLERAIRAFASTLLSLWVVGGVVFNLKNVDWYNSMAIAGGAAVISVLLSIVSATSSVPKGSPDFINPQTTMVKDLEPGKGETNG